MIRGFSDSVGFPSGSESHSGPPSIGSRHPFHERLEQIYTVPNGGPVS
jgi:hypothetical protein